MSLFPSSFVQTSCMHTPPTGEYPSPDCNYKWDTLFIQEFSRFGGNIHLWPTLLKHERYGWGEVQSVPPVTNEYHSLLVTWEGNSRLAPADKSNHFKLQANYSTTLTDYGDLLKMGQFPVSLPQPSDDSSCDQQDSSFKYKCSLLYMYQPLFYSEKSSGSSRKPTHSTSSQTIMLKTYLMTGSIMHMYSRHQATCQLFALTSSRHTARAPTGGFYSKNCQRDGGNVLTPNAVNVLAEYLAIPGCTLLWPWCQLQLCRVGELKYQAIWLLLYKV
jgi:hypothetical protein